MLCLKFGSGGTDELLKQESMEVCLVSSVNQWVNVYLPQWVVYSMDPHEQHIYMHVWTGIQEGMAADLHCQTLLPQTTTVGTLNIQFSKQITLQVILNLQFWK